MNRAATRIPAAESDEVTPAADHNRKDIAENIVPEKELGGRDGPDPTRYGDWEKNGRCIDF